MISLAFNEDMDRDGKVGRPAPFRPAPSKPVKNETSRVKISDRVQNLTPPRLVADLRVGGNKKLFLIFFLQLNCYKKNYVAFIIKKDKRIGSK